MWNSADNNYEKHKKKKSAILSDSLKCEKQNEKNNRRHF